MASVTESLTLESWAIDFFTLLMKSSIVVNSIILILLNLLLRYSALASLIASNICLRVSHAASASGSSVFDTWCNSLSRVSTWLLLEIKLLFTIRRVNRMICSNNWLLKMCAQWMKRALLHIRDMLLSLIVAKMLRSLWLLI